MTSMGSRDHLQSSAYSCPSLPNHLRQLPPTTYLVSSYYLSLLVSPFFHNRPCIPIPVSWGLCEDYMRCKRVNHSLSRHLRWVSFRFNLTPNTAIAELLCGLRRCLVSIDTEIVMMCIAGALLYATARAHRPFSVCRDDITTDVYSANEKLNSIPNPLETNISRSCMSGTSASSVRMQRRS